jgi:hypothetical protein
MPLVGMLHLIIAIGFGLHAHRTGRPQVWMFILIFLPLVGSVAYVLFELLPELANGRRARRVANDLRTVLDPDREWRECGQKVLESDTVEAKCAFAEECERKGMWDDAITMYRRAAGGVYADDPELLRGLARALLGSGDPRGAVDTLDRLRDTHPNYQHQDAHLTYARALEAQDRLGEAESEYRALATYFIGMEARTRHGLLLRRLGEPLAAKRVFDDVVRRSKARGVVLSDQDRAWVRLAKLAQ